MTGEAPRASASPGDDERIDQTVGEQPDPARVASIEGIGLMASKGWLPERKLLVIHDFFMARGLYADFNNYIRRMR